MAQVVESFYGRSPLLSHSSRDEEDYIFYQSHPQKQMLLYDLATSFCVLTYLKMQSISPSIKVMPNAEYMDNGGRLPIVYEKSSEKLMSGFTEVYWHINRKFNITPTMLELSYMDWIETKFLEFEMYICWCSYSNNSDKGILLETYTQNWYTHDLPWPIGKILFNRKRKQMELAVKSKFESQEDLMEKFNKFLIKLHKRIGSKTYCLSDAQPSCVDALIYGHKKALFTTKEILEKKGVPSENIIALMVDAVTRQRRIINLTETISKLYPS